MYTLLIADDDKFERDGIRRLAEKHKLGLRILEAENGQKALDAMADNAVDILLTDIKMPFMTGLELAAIARERFPHLKMIIYSAYGEFEYAKQAIDVSVVSYLLKPMETDEFLRLMNSMIQTLDEERQIEEKGKALLDAYSRGLSFEKEKLLLDVLNGMPVSEPLLHRLETAGIKLHSGFHVMALIDYKVKFFDRQDAAFAEALTHIVLTDYVYLNLNEYESLLLLQFPKKPERKLLQQLGERIQDEMLSRSIGQVTIVFGQSLASVADFAGEFAEMEQVMDFKFFFDESKILFTHEDASKTGDMTQRYDDILKIVYASIQRKQYLELEQAVELLFHMFKTEGNASIIFVMYICAEIVKKLIKHDDPIADQAFVAHLEHIFKCANLNELKKSVLAAVDKIRAERPEDAEERNKHAVKEILELVDAHYMEDISLEWLAQKVFLTPTYISYLFKKEMNVSLIKYITQYRLDKAKSLLRHTNMKIVDVAKQVGYIDSSYFGRSFKNCFGLSPAQFREMGETK